MRRLEIVRLRLRSLFRRARLERELDQEIRFHLEQQIEENLAGGMTPTEARRAALVAFGGVAQIQEDCRDRRRVNLLEQLVRDFHYGLRMMRKSAALTAAAVLTLALGIGANTAIFSAVDAVLLRRLPYPDSDRLVQIWQ